MASNIVKGKEKVLEIIDVRKETRAESIGEKILSCDDEASQHLNKKQKEDSHYRSKFKSQVWEWFTKFKDSDGKDRAKCNFCSKIYAADPRKNGTSALRAHMTTLCRFRKVPPNQKCCHLPRKKRMELQLEL